MIKESLTEELNNIEKVKFESEDLTEEESEENDDWLGNNYRVYSKHIWYRFSYIEGIDLQLM